MKKVFSAALLLLCSTHLIAQATFKAGWDTYQTALITRQYTYTFTPNDSFRLYMADSSVTLAARDSAAVEIVKYPLKNNHYTKTINYYNNKKQLTKSEEYSNDNLNISKEWKYDEKNRKTAYYEDNKVSERTTRKTYEYANDKKTGYLVITECSYNNGRPEFYTKSYYDRKMVKVKEVRLNDNNKDVIHIETYNYGPDGRVKERTVYFPEFKVTKKFIEDNGPSETPKCVKSLPLSPSEKIYAPGKAIYLRNFLSKIRSLLSDPDCTQFEYKYSNLINEIVVCTSKLPNTQEVILRYKERP